MPRRKRLFDRACRVIAVIAVHAGVRACICMMPTPALMLVVRARIQAERRHRVGAVGLAAPHRIVAQPLGLQDLVQREMVAVIAQEHSQPHGHLPPRSPASSGIASAAKRSICRSRSS